MYTTTNLELFSKKHYWVHTWSVKSFICILLNSDNHLVRYFFSHFKDKEAKCQNKYLSDLLEVTWLVVQSLGHVQLFATP